MRKVFLACTALLILHITYAQPGSLNRGFYRNYREYLNNSPSLTIPFTTKLFIAGKKDHTIIAAEYEVADSSKEDMGEIWGFCDGYNIFVQTSTIFDFYYWKLQCRGPNPYFYEKTKRISIGGGLIGLAATAGSLAVPANFDLMFVDKEGKTQVASRHFLKKLLKDEPVLFSSYTSEKEIYDSLNKQYISGYNEAKMHK